MTVYDAAHMDGRPDEPLRPVDPLTAAHILGRLSDEQHDQALAIAIECGPGSHVSMRSFGLEGR